MKELKNILLVSGSGRNCGKTTLACNVISKVTEKENVIGIKISPHFHRMKNNHKLVAEGFGFHVFRELSIESEKDSSRMLKAGASEVYFIQSEDADLEGAFEKLHLLIPANIPIVCESGSLANVFKPGLHLLIKGENADENKKSFVSNLKKADFILSKDDFSIDDLNFEIEFSSQKWVLKKNES
jgi:hypothetical protein